MTSNTITFKCDRCEQELTFYRDSFAYDGCYCPACDPLGYRPMLKLFSENIRGSEDVKATRELYRKQSKNTPTMTIEEALNSR